MKTNKFLFIAAGFFGGLVSGISMIALFAFTNAPANPGSGGGSTPITAADANLYLKNYLAGAASLNQVVKGFTIDKTQLDAMNSIALENSGLTGFRIYMGIDSQGRKVAIVVGVNSNGTDAVNNTILNTNSQSTNPCPPVCDVNSPITGD